MTADTPGRSVIAVSDHGDTAVNLRRKEIARKGLRRLGMGAIMKVAARRMSLVAYGSGRVVVHLR